MPIENERKYVMPPDFDAAELDGWARFDIRQGYLDDGPRIRQIGDVFLFTYKKWVPYAKELVEIETVLSIDDFNLLWPLCVESLVKTRYVKRTDDGEWVVDFLRDEEGRVYFVMAEVEMPRFQALPETIPPEIAGHILHSVAADDNRFTNKKLSDRDYARKMLAKIAG